MQPKQRHLSKLSGAVLVQLFILVFLGTAIALLGHFFPVMTWITLLQNRVGEMQVWGGVLYPLLCAACNVLLLPGGVLALGSGLFFGLWWGTFLVVTGNVLAAAIAFFISRKLGRRWIEKKAMQSQRWRNLDAAINREGWKIIFFTQVHPLFPTSLLNYIYGVTSIRFWPCMLWVTLGQIPGVFLYAYLGTLAQLGVKLVQGKTHPHAFEYYLWFGGLLAAVVFTTVLGRVALRILASLDEPQSENASTQTAVEAVPQHPLGVSTGTVAPLAAPSPLPSFDTARISVTVTPKRYV